MLLLLHESRLILIIANLSLHGSEAVAVSLRFRVRIVVFVQDANQCVSFSFRTMSQPTPSKELLHEIEKGKDLKKAKAPQESSYTTQVRLGSFDASHLFTILLRIAPCLLHRPRETESIHPCAAPRN